MSAVSLSLAVARAAESAARGIAGVADLSAGTIGEFSTYGSGERVSGVRVRTGDDPSVGLRLVVEYGRPLPELVDEVRARVLAEVTPLFGREVPVNLEIVDVTMQAEAERAAAAELGAGPAALTSPPSGATVKAEGGTLTWQS